MMQLQRWFLAAALSLTFLSLGVLTKERSRWIKQEATAMANQPQEIKLGAPLEGTMQGKQTHSYSVELKAGQFMYVVVEQKGIDVVVELRGPDGKLLTSVDSPSGDEGPETVSEVAQADGAYRVDVISDYDDAPAGLYEIRMEELRDATDADRRYVEADRIFAQAEELRRQPEKESRIKAVEEYQRALAIWQGLPQQKLAKEAHCLQRIGMIQRDLGDFKNAQFSLERALSIFQDRGDRLWVGLVSNWLGPIYFIHGDSELALESSRTALRIGEELGRRALVAGAWNNIGRAHTYLGEADEALQAFQAALSSALESNDQRNGVVARNGLGDLLLYQGKLEEALDALTETLSLAQQIGAQRTEAATLSRLANLYQRRGDYDKAFEHLDRALEIRKKIGDRRGEAVTLGSLGTLYLLSKDLEKSKDRYQQAFSIFREIGEQYGQAIALLNLGRNYWQNGDYQKAFELHEESSRIFQSIGNRRGEASTLFGSARALHDLGNFAAALERLNKVVENVELLRSESENPDLRIAYFATRQHYYELHIDVLMHMHEKDPQAGFDAQALRINEHRRARGLVDLLAESEADLRSGGKPELLAEVRELESKLNATERTLVNQLEGRPNADQSEALERQQRELVQRLYQAWAKIRRENPRFRRMAQPNSLELEQIQDKLLDDYSLMLVYSLGEERSFLWCIPREGKLSSHILPVRSYLEEAARNVHKRWGEGTKPASLATRWATRLSDELLKPVSDKLGKKRLLIVPDGWLQYVPFAALPEPGASESQQASPEAQAGVPLVANHEVIHLPSATVLGMLRRQFGDRLPAPRRAAVFADPVFSPDDPRIKEKSARDYEAVLARSLGLRRAASDLGIPFFERLPDSRKEAEILRELIADESMRFEALDFEANKEAVNDPLLRRYRLIHFATHGILNRKQPELSGLVLSLVDEEGNPRDGFLHTHEIFNLDLNAELVVLSACQTGVGEEVKGEGLMSLTRAFMYAGAPRLIVSLWQVSDEGTAELMKRFYERLFSGGLYPAAALRCAQRSMYQDPQWNSPYHWAGFFFQGDWLHQIQSGDVPIERLAVGEMPVDPPDDDLPPPIPVEPPGCPPEDSFKGTHGSGGGVDD